MKQTAVEWLVEQLDLDLDLKWAVNQAKEMEKQQIIEAHGDKQKIKSNPGSIVTYGFWYKGEDYYNDNFNKENK